jgi:hypothetical protein
LVDGALATAFFRDIAANLVSGGPLFSADLCAPCHEPERESLLRVWQKQASTAGIPENCVAFPSRISVRVIRVL